MHLELQHTRRRLLARTPLRCRGALVGAPARRKRRLVAGPHAPLRHAAAPVREQVAPRTPRESGPCWSRSISARTCSRASLGLTLVERFDTAKSGIFQRNEWARSLLYRVRFFATKYSFLKHFPRSTRFAHLRTAPNQKFNKISSNFFECLLRFLQSS